MRKMLKKSGLAKDVEKICIELCGEEVAKQIVNFDDPGKYPKDFVEETIYFISRLVDPVLVKNKFKPVLKKYKIKVEEWPA